MFQINDILSREPVKLDGMELEFQSGSVETGITGPKGQSGVRYNLRFKLILNFENFTNNVLKNLPHFYEDKRSNVRPELGGFAYYVSNFLIRNANNLKEKSDLHNFLINSTSWIDSWAEAVGTGYLVKYEKPTFSSSSDDELYIEAAQSFVFSDTSKTFEISDIPVTPLSWTLYLRDEIEDDDVGGEINLAYFPNEIVYVDDSRLYKDQLYISGKYLTLGPVSREQIKKA